MTKIFRWFLKTACDWAYFFFVIAVLLGLNKIIIGQEKIQESLVLIQKINIQSATVTIDGLLFIAEQLKESQANQNYVIEQNRSQIEADKIKEQANKIPSYEELKSHTVYIVGCSDLLLTDNKCWSGTGSVVKITDTETYILTNAHVAGKDEPNVFLYVQNGKDSLLATVVKYHSDVDLAVIKVQGKIEEKTEIPGYAIPKIQDKVYVVGNPLGNKMTYTEGVVANFRGIDVFIQAPLIYGNSGSAIINQQGQLIGVCYALQGYAGFIGFPEVQITHALCVDSLSVQFFLKDLGLINQITYN